MMLLITLLFGIAFSQSYVCTPTIINSTMWQQNYPSIYAFNGFYRGDGTLKILDAMDNTLFSLNINGSIYHQYFDANGVLYSDLFLPILVPGVLVLTSRATLNPILSANRVCQIFSLPSPPNLIVSYSELLPLGIGYMTSWYTGAANVTLGQVFSNEYFDFDATFSSAFSKTLTYATGLGTAGHYVLMRVNYAYIPISQDQATSLGWNANALPYVSLKGIAGGRGAIPIEIIPLVQRLLYNL